VILHGDHGGFGAQHAVVALDQHLIGKFQRLIDSEQNFVRRPELDDRVLEKGVFGFVCASVAIAVPISAAELDGNPDWRASGKNLAKRLTMSASGARAVAW